MLKLTLLNANVNTAVACSANVYANDANVNSANANNVNDANTNSAKC